jgi:hypothetical protein
MAFVGVVSRIGAVSAPFVVELKRIHPTLAFGLMGGLSVIAALLCLVLPETRGMPTAEVYDNNGKVILYCFLVTMAAMSHLKLINNSSVN